MDTQERQAATEAPGATHSRGTRDALWRGARAKGQVGRIEWIGFAPQPGAPIEVVTQAQAELGRGLRGDHNARRRFHRRHVTLIRSEDLEQLSQLMGRSVEPQMLRRNVVVSGVDLRWLRGRRFRLGDALLRGGGPCRPCGLLDETLGLGGKAAARGLSGIVAVVLEGGRLRVGDALVQGPTGR